MIQTPLQSDLLVSRLECLADPIRLRLIRLLVQRELGVADLCRVTGLPQSTVSRHLRVLTDRKWTQARREGTANLYRISFDDLDEGSRNLWEAAARQLAGAAIIEEDDLRLSRLLTERQADSREFFAQAADQWSELRRKLYGEAFSLHAMLALLPHDWVVADLGCGTGELSRDLGRHVARVHAVDQSPEMLDTARQTCADLPHILPIQAELTDLPLESESCDAALMTLVLSYIEPVDRALVEAARILKRGGRLVVVDLLRHEQEQFRRQMGQAWAGFEPIDLQQRLERAGLTNLYGYPLTNPDNPQAMTLWLQAARR